MHRQKIITMDISSILLSLGINILSSMVYDIGKAFIANGEQPLTEEQIVEIICAFQGELDKILLSQNNIKNRIDFLQNQNETIIKLLLAVFYDNNTISIKCTENGYQLDGEYTLNCLNNKANDCLNNYWNSLPNSVPETLGKAVWPIPTKIREVLLDEIQQHLYNDER